ncbi:hypothetical protein LCGC14_1788590 [marine sediment metagenome]
MGLPDRIMRLVLAAIAPVLYAADIINGVFAIVLLSISGILLITSLVSLCPVYLPFGINTETKPKS